MTQAMFLVLVASVCALAVLMLSTKWAPMVGDYAEWTYHGLLLRDVLQGHPDSAYVLKTYPVPNSTTTVGLGFLMLLLPWKIATKVWLLMGIVLGAVAAVQLQIASGRPQGWKFVILPAAVLVGTAFWSGYENFMFGLAFAMIICAMLLRSVESRWLYGLVLVLTFFSHMIPFGFAVFLLGMYAWQEQRWKLLWQAVPSLLLSGWYFAGRWTHGNVDASVGLSEEKIAYLSPTFLAFKVNSYLKCWGFVNPAYTSHDSVLLRIVGVPVFLALMMLDFMIATGVLVLLVRAARQGLRQRHGQCFFWMATVVFFAVALAMPSSAAGIADPGGRMIQVALWCGLCLVSTKRRWSERVLASCAGVLLVSDLLLFGGVAMRPPMTGDTNHLPARVRQFGHGFYSNRERYYAAIEDGNREMDIFPTAMFLKR